MHVTPDSSCNFTGEQDDQADKELEQREKEKKINCLFKVQDLLLLHAIAGFTRLEDELVRQKSIYI